MQAFAAFVAPMVIFLVLIAPLWLILHYRNKERTQTSLSVDEKEELEALAIHAERLEERIRILEAILDEETPHWRKQRSQS